MPQKCRVCAHAKTRKMEELFVAGKPKTQIAEKYGVGSQSVDYHMEHHLPQKLVRTVRKKEQKHAEGILDGINDLLTRTKDILNEASEDDQKTTALSAIREARNIYELLSKIAVRLEEYRREDEAKEDQLTSSQISEGLKVLSTSELKAFIQLQAKIFSANPDYELDPAVRYVIDAIAETGYASSRSGKGGKDGDGKNGFGTKYQPAKSRSKSPRTGPRQDRNSQKTKEDAPELLDDLDGLDLEDLSLDKDNEIPSEESDPKWLRDSRRRRRRRNR